MRIGVTGPCHPNPCHNGGTCEISETYRGDTFIGYVCKCASGFNGIHCQHSKINDLLMKICCVAANSIVSVAQLWDCDTHTHTVQFFSTKPKDRCSDLIDLLTRMNWLSFTHGKKINLVIVAYGKISQFIKSRLGLYIYVGRFDVCYLFLLFLLTFSNFYPEDQHWHAKCLWNDLTGGSFKHKHAFRTRSLNRFFFSHIVHLLLFLLIIF